MDGEQFEVGGQRKTTKKEVEQWITDNIKACGLNWRVGFMIKLRASRYVYEWLWIKDNSPLKK